MRYVLLFLEGIIAFISPCVLPMLPVYISYFAANETNGRKTLLNAVGFVIGFSVVFVALGAFAGSAGRLIKSHAAVFNAVSGAVVILFGLNISGALKIKFLNNAAGKAGPVKKLGVFSSFVLGVIFSIGWTPCVGAFLGSALILASHGASLFQGITMLSAFSLGLGLPFIASALLIDRLKGAFDFIKRNYKIINIISGALLIVIGLLMATGFMGYFLSFLTF